MFVCYLFCFFKSETADWMHSGERSGSFNEALQTGKPFLLYIGNRQSELKLVKVK